MATTGAIAARRQILRETLNQRIGTLMVKYGATPPAPRPDAGIPTRDPKIIELRELERLNDQLGAILDAAGVDEHKAATTKPGKKSR